MLQGLEVPDPWAALPVEVVTAVSSSTLSLHPDEGPLSTKGTLGFYVYFSAGNKGKAASSLLFFVSIFPFVSSPELSPKTLSSLMVTFCPQKMP